MRLPLLLLAGGSLLLTSLRAGPDTAEQGRWVPADSPEIVYEGRTAVTPRDGVRMGFPGIIAHLRVQGGELALRVDAAMDDEYFDVQVDGRKPRRLRLHRGVGEYALLTSVLPGNGPSSVHRIELTRRTEGWQGECEFLGFLLDPGGRLLRPDPLPTRRLMFIGDSSTCGEGADFRPGDPVKDNKESDARLSYAMLLARRLYAQCHLVAYGGRGVLRDWQGNTNLNNFPQQYYERTLPDDPDSHWDPRDYVPDAVGVCLGVNDFDVGIPDQELFVDAFVRFLRQIRQDAPNARIFLIESPILSDLPGRVSRRAVLLSYLKDVAAAMQSPLVQVIPTSYQPGRPGNTHPTAAQQVATADEIEPALRSALDW